MKKGQEFLRDSYKRRKNAAMETLRTHLGNDIVFTSIWAEAVGERELDEEELLEGEVSASVCIVGCYTVRIAYCLYVDDKEATYIGKIPAGQDKMTVHRNEEGHIGQGLKDNGFAIATLYPIGKGVRMVTEVSARYYPGSESSANLWRNICTAAPDHEQVRSIGFICAVKRNDMVPDEEAALFVLNNFWDGFCAVDYWYKFMPDGKVEEYRIGGPEPQDVKTKWEL